MIHLQRNLRLKGKRYDFTARGSLRCIATSAGGAATVDAQTPQRRKPEDDKAAATRILDLGGMGCARVIGRFPARVRDLQQVQETKKLACLLDFREEPD